MARRGCLFWGAHRMTWEDHEGRADQGAWKRAVIAKSAKLVASKRGRCLLVRRRRDKRWMFPGGRKRPRETEKQCLLREIKEELPKLKVGCLKLWRTSRRRTAARVER